MVLLYGLTEPLTSGGREARPAVHSNIVVCAAAARGFDGVTIVLIGH
jgi:hypothetical protein